MVNIRGYEGLEAWTVPISLVAYPPRAVAGVEPPIDVPKAPPRVEDVYPCFAATAAAALRIAARAAAGSAC
jgi:hypothetical protein